MTKPGHHYHLGGSLTSLALLSSSNTSNRVTYDISDLTVIIRVTTPPVYAGSEYLTVDSSQKYYTALIWPSFGISNPEIIPQFAWLIRSCDLGLSWHSSQPSQSGRAVCDGQEDTGRCMGQVWSMIKLWLIVTGMENRSDERERVVNIKIISCRHRNRLSETFHVTEWEGRIPEVPTIFQCVRMGKLRVSWEFSFLCCQPEIGISPRRKREREKERE